MKMTKKAPMKLSPAAATRIRKQVNTAMAVKSDKNSAAGAAY